MCSLLSIWLNLFQACISDTVEITIDYFEFTRVYNTRMLLPLCLLIAEIGPVYIDASQTMASNYYPPGIVINENNSAEINVVEDNFTRVFCGVHLSIISDNNVSTCVPVAQTRGQLQAIFTFPTLPSKQDLSAKIILRNADDCNSSAWTWFTESDCHRGIYTECSHTLMNRINEHTYCVSTCHCLGSCDLFYLKYNNIPWKNQNLEQLCEIWARWNMNMANKWRCTSSDLAIRLALLISLIIPPDIENRMVSHVCRIFVEDKCCCGINVF